MIQKILPERINVGSWYLRPYGEKFGATWLQTATYPNWHHWHDGTLSSSMSSPNHSVVLKSPLGPVPSFVYRSSYLEGTLKIVLLNLDIDNYTIGVLKRCTAFEMPNTIYFRKYPFHNSQLSVISPSLDLLIFFSTLHCRRYL